MNPPAHSADDDSPWEAEPATAHVGTPMTNLAKNLKGAAAN